MPAEYHAIDFDAESYTDSDWWKQQDDELERDELERIETEAEIFDLRINGYE